MLKYFGKVQLEAMPLTCDNMLAIAMTKNPVFHHRTRHIKRKYHIIRDTLKLNVIQLLYCKIEDQVVDIFTKPLPKERFIYLTDLLGVKAKSILKGSVGI